MNFHHGYYKKKENIRIRKVYEWGSCLIYVPKPPNLSMLNLNAMLILEICDGKTYQEIEDYYIQRISHLMSNEKAQIQLREGLKLLESNGIIEYKTN